MKGNLYTFGFMTGVCVACSLFVSGFATFLEDAYRDNQQTDIQCNILAVVGLEIANLSGDEVQELYERKISLCVVDGFGKEVEEEAKIDPKFLQDLAKSIAKIQSLDEKLAKSRSRSNDVVAGWLTKEIQANKKKLRLPVYELRGLSDGPVNKYCIPIAGKGLWSTLYGYLALEEDGRTIAGITFYLHGETPGLGGEVDNPTWKAQFPGKIFDRKGDFPILVTKPGASFGDHAVDGLSGATITSDGVQKLLKVAREVYRPYFEKEIWKREGT